MIADLQNLTSAIPQLSTVSCQFRYFLVPFPQLRMVLKITPIYLELFVSLETKTCLKGTVAQGFLLPIFFFTNQPDSTAKNMPKIAKVKLSSCGFEVADFRKNCDCRIAELRLQSNITLKSCGIVIP